jgi:acetyl coenzyme A synthetase (ADP forming)-like protein
MAVMTSDLSSDRGEDVVLRDGMTVRIRVVRASDLVRVEDYLIGLSDETRMLRFGSPTLDIGATSAAIVAGTTDDHLTLLAFQGGEEGEVIGGTQFFRIDADHAEVSVSVADRLQGHGLGSILIGRIAQAASEAGIGTLVASVRPENHRMIAVFRESGFSPMIRAVPGMIDVEFPTSITDDAAEVFEERAAEAAHNAVKAFLAPASVAVVGASRNAAAIGSRLFRNLIVTDFNGVVYPVNPNAASIHGVACFRSIQEIPGPVDVAFVCVPADLVLEVVRGCGEKGVRGVVVISAGFSETGDDGTRRERELLEICRGYGMRLIGPNCMGIANGDPEVMLNGTFASSWLLPGHVGFMSQSGALGIAVMEQTARLGLGLSSFISVGNKADVSGNDLLCYWERDPLTEVILLYLESFGNPRRFARIARRVAERKPIVVVKSGRSAAGARATSSHTGAILRSSDAVVDALFHQTGVIRTDTLEEMLDVATLLGNQPLPKGKRVGIVTNAGGLAILCADAAEARGLSVAGFSDETRSALRAFLPAEASVSNPVDMIASAGGEDYGHAIRVVADSGEVDALIVIYIPPLEDVAAEVAEHVRNAIAELDGKIPVLTSFLSARGLPDQLSGGPRRVPSFPYPEQAAIALAQVANLGAWRERRRGDVPVFADVRPDEAAAILAGALEQGQGWIDASDAVALLDHYGIAVARSERAGTPEEAGAAAERIRGRVALKALGPLHKTEAGAVRLGLAGAKETAAAAAQMQRRLVETGAPFEGFLVQEMIEGGVEMLVGVAHDETFGPVVMCGAGGTTAELIGDVAVRVPPLTDVDASEMLCSLSTFPLLEGYRGSPRAAVEAFEEVILRLGALVEAHPSVVEMDCNPVTVTAERAVVLDVRVRVEPSSPMERIGAVS